MGLKLIQGGGQSQIGSIGKLRLVTQDDTVESISEEYVSFLYSRVAFYWKSIGDRLTLKQFQATMGVSQYEAKARIALKVSKNSEVMRLSQEILALCDQVKGLEALTKRQNQAS